MKRRRIGFFGGTFDPIHFGHINLALELQEQHQLDEVLFCPAACSPFKTSAPPHASAQDRLAMLQQALSELPFCSLCSLEIERPGPSYTIDTLRALQRPDVQFFTLLSEETFRSFDQWKEAKALSLLAPLLVGSRPQQLTSDLTLCATFTPTRIFEISSHEIRERIRQNRYCGHLLPTKVLDYIHTHRVYS